MAVFAILVLARLGGGQKAALVGLAVAGLIALVVWANRCECGRFFTVQTISRVSQGSGYVGRMVHDQENQRAVYRRVFEYRYQRTDRCSACGVTRTVSERSRRPKPTGVFGGYWAPDDAEAGSAPDDAEAGQAPAPSTWRGRLLGGPWFVKLGKGALLLVGALVLGFPLAEPDVLRYPSHASSYLERYVERFSKPFGVRTRRARLGEVDVEWAVGFSVEEYDGERWRWVDREVRTGRGAPGDGPPPLAEAGPEPKPGQRRMGGPIEEVKVSFRAASGERYAVDDFITFLRVSDRTHVLVDLTAELGRYFAEQSAGTTWKADVLAFESGGCTVSLFVADAEWDALCDLKREAGRPDAGGR